MLKKNMLFYATKLNLSDLPDFIDRISWLRVVGLESEITELSPTLENIFWKFYSNFNLKYCRIFALLCQKKKHI